MKDKIVILKELKDNLQKQYQNSVKEVILFGSQSRGTANVNSDFDVLIVLDHEYSGKDENMILNICYNIDLKYNIIIDAHLLSTKELSTIRGRQPIFKNALISGIYA